jgi:hypothetical protein
MHYIGPTTTASQVVEVWPGQLMTRDVNIVGMIVDQYVAPFPSAVEYFPCC